MIKTQLSRAEGIALVEGWKLSGKTIRAYCEEKGLPTHRLNYWKGIREKTESPIASRNKFVPIQINETPGNAPVEIQTPTGYYIKFFQPISVTEICLLVK